MKGGQLFTSLDLFTGYLKIKLHGQWHEMTTFCCKFGSFCFVLMSFGVENGAACFQRMPAVLLQDLLFVIVYLENIVLKYQSCEEHIKKVGIVLGRLQEAGLTLQVKKCEFGRPEIALLSHILSTKTVRTDPDTVGAILNALLPSAET